jgi:hypothetical protein
MAVKGVLSVSARELDLVYRYFENFEDIDRGVDRLVRWI